MKVWHSEAAWLPALLLAVVVGVVYGTTFFNDWTYDDYHVIVANPAVQSLPGLLKSVATPRFLRDMSLFLDFTLWGPSPGGYHVQQLLLHWLNALLVWRICLTLGSAPGAALFGSILFVVHPLQVESIANISHRKEPLALLFVLIMLVFYRKACQENGSKQFRLLGGATFSFALAMMANETAVTAPLVLVAYEALFCPASERLLLRRPGLLLAAMAGIGVCGGIWLMITFPLEEHLFKVYTKQAFYASPTYLPLFLGCLQVIALYAGKLLVPISLAPEYVIGFTTNVWQPLALVGALLAVCLLVLAHRLRHSRPLISFGILVFAILYLPIANFFPVAYMMADRYLYMPLAGLSFATAGLLSVASQRKLTYGTTLVLLLFGAMAIRQSTFWRSEHTLWRHAVLVNPDSSWVQGAAAKSYLRNGELELARDHAQRAITIDRQNTAAYLTLARAEERSGNLPIAVGHYETFLAIGRNDYPRETADVAAYLPYLRRRLEQGR